MLDTSFILWLQQWASPALTEIMRAVSLWGYVPSCLAAAIVFGFGGRLRLGVTLDPGHCLRRRDDGRRKKRVRVASSACCRCRRPNVRRFRVGSAADGHGHLGAGGRLRFSLWTRGNDRGMGHGSRLVARKSWQLGVAATWVAPMALYE